MTPRCALARSIALALSCMLLPSSRADEKPANSSDPATAPNQIDIEAIRSRTGGANGGPPGVNDPAKYRPFAELTANATKHDGLFTLYEKDDHLYAEIKPFQFDQSLLVPITIARGLEMAGNPLNFGDEWVVSFHRVGDKVQLIRKNIHVKAPFNTPIDKAVKQNYTDSILMALPIVSLNPGGGMSVVIDFSDIFFTNFAQLPMGFLDRSRTSWNKIKTFPTNLEMEVQATFGGVGGQSGADGLIDSRGATIVIHYSLVKLPDGGYHPRVADDRVGHFLNATRDFGANDPDGNVVRYVNRWRLEKAESKAKLSPPKKQIVWYIEDTVPVEFRSYVQDGIEEWNKAFEKIGYRDAIAVRWQESGRDDFDPEDINYCTFRWITTSSTYAMSCLRSNPITGEMIDGDVIFDASWIRAWKNEYAQLVGGVPAAQGQESPSPIAFGEVISPMLAMKRGYGEVLGGDGSGKNLSMVPAGWSGLHRDLLERLANGQQASCRFASGMQPELGLAAMVMADAVKADPEAKLPEEFLGQLIKEVVMHEVGHSLGLRHNFKASTMLDTDQINDPAITRVKGMTGSVMDYNPINIAPKGQKQGDYITTVLGPYDYWAIEYAYKEVMGNESDELKKIASRAPEPDLVFATDTDMRIGHDPLVNVYDLGSDPCRFAKDRLTLAAQLMKELDAKVVKEGESWARASVAFSYLMNQYGNAADLVSSQIGGQSISRHHKGDKDAADPIVPIAGDKQRAALSFLVENLLSDQSFQFSPALLRRLSKEHWDMGAVSDNHRGIGDISVNDRVLAIQRIALSHCLSGSVLTRLQNQELQSDPGTKPLAVAEVFRLLTDGIYGEITIPGEGKPKTLSCSTIRRNLQRDYLQRLSTIILGPARATNDNFAYVVMSGGGAYPADARALARLHLKEIGEKIGKVLDAKDLQIDETCRAHFEELRQKIAMILAAQISTSSS
ncbi:zinc-dependent metalloprotease [Tundrisphaera lichenicola]|uniref:zinc-dependent metalloprotease n=1 Tax=Tundrisphaera lichenicola TaxID=2029860 RepID=UPI003EBF90C7